MLAPSRIEAAEVVVVGLADLAVVRESSLVLSTQALGACLGVTIFDPVARVAGILHSMLPDSSLDAARAAARPGMFLDTGLAAMLAQARQLHATKENLQLCVAGGARILDDSAHFNIGGRNFEVLKILLDQHGLSIHAHDVGGLSNRSIFLNAVTGEVLLRISGKPQPRSLCKPSTIT
jgi:chemotaxis protein CheD